MIPELELFYQNPVEPHLELSPIVEIPEPVKIEKKEPEPKIETRLGFFALLFMMIFDKKLDFEK